MIQATRTSIRTSFAPCIRMLMALFVLCSLQVPAANAAIVDTETLVATQSERAKVAEFLQREQVQQVFVEQGVDPQVALERVDRLTDAEIALLSEKIDDMPAGGDVVGAILLVFFVLLITDLLGLTSVFPFVNR
jgi:hypothetical protein